MEGWIIVSFISAYLVSGTFGVYSPANEFAIRNLMLTGYDPVSRPTVITNVQVEYNIISIIKVDLKLQQKKLAAWLTLKWEDSRLTWTPASNNDIEYVFFTPATIWKPEVVIDNSVEDLGVIADDNLLLRVKYDGTVEWEPARLFTVHCSVDVTYYPYDQQKCGVKIISRGYRKNELTLTHLATEINRDNYVENGEWMLTGTKLETTDVSEEDDGATVYYSQLYFVIFLRRRPDYYVINNILPISLSSFLMVVVFALPADSGEKASYALTVLLAHAVLLTIIANKLPEISLTTSILGNYLAITLIIASIITVITVWILILHNRKTKPDCTSRFYKASFVIGRLMHVTPAGSSLQQSTSSVAPITADTDEKMDEPRMANGTMEWHYIAAAWDRFFFYLSFAVVSIVAITCLLMISEGGNNSTPT